MKRVNWHLNGKWIRLKVYPRPYDPCVFYIDEQVNKSDWSKSKQRVLSSDRNADYINELIDAVEHFTISQIREHKKRGDILTASRLKEILERKFKGSGVRDGLSFFEYCEKWYELVKNRINPKTLNAYRVKVEMCKKYFPYFDWSDINWSWRNRSYNDLIENGYLHNTVAKMYGVIRTINNDAVADGVSSVTIYPKKWMPTYVDSGAIYIDSNEVKDLFSYKYSSDRLANAVKNWKIQYLTACRYNEIKRVLDGQIIYTHGKRILRWKQSKGKNHVSVVIGSELSRLLEDPPVILSNPKLNKYIKEAAREAGIKEWDQVTTHTARRSCATNMALNGYPITLISKMLGHATERETKKYIRYSDIESAIMVSEHTPIEFRSA